MILTYVVIIIALFFAMNIGASGAAATMGPAYGSGAVPRKRIALWLVAIGAFLGAIIGSHEVVTMVGEGIIPAQSLTVEIAFVILLSSTLTLFLANILGIPLSTSEVTIGSIVGVGVAFQTLYVQNILIIVSLWVIIPIVAFTIAWIFGKLINYFQTRKGGREPIGKKKKWLVFLLIAVGVFEAFAAGMNNVANAIGPVIGAGLLDETTGIWLGGAFLALGALFLGGKVLETNGKKITSLSVVQGITVSGTGGTLVTIASLFGIPVPLTQVTTSAIVGIGTADNGFQLWHQTVIKKIVKVWVVSPVFALVFSYSMVHVILLPNPYVILIVISILVATLGSVSLYKSINEEKRSIHDQGGGI
ncbi:inorganic phosphate transporter [Texcoconibacillus texcoconensis]|uniref:Phosphate transporter n=1 Tax=Texcoconibacillus texcoconensis TaxID=1095777 RepID=A0A840QLW1_9BACI|nr:inorganic phosphate transporter [Texcoconibacillus texcoconensis]MBB5172343.1 sulfate permease [Texcoconibacillus texcoconensis]